MRRSVQICLLIALALCALYAFSFTFEGVARPPGRKLQQTLLGPAEDLEQYRLAGCDNFMSDRWQPLRPGYHLTVPYGWLNDPHGMFQLNGTTHVFIQYNPKKIQWGAPFWAHVVSDDLAHWQWLPPALLPDTNYDFNGVWSGGATVPEETGVPILTYTAASTLVPEYGNFFQRQAMAVPANMSDPKLKLWIKPDTNPFLVQVAPGGTNFQFRDPTEARHAVWLALSSEDNPQPLNRSHFALAVGHQAHCMGGASMYTAPTMAGPWSFVGNLFSQLDLEPEINGQCRANRAANTTAHPWPGPAYGGPCDQFGAFCRMWEVVDFAQLDNDVWLLKWSDQSHFRGIFSLEWYVLGNGPFNYDAVNPPAGGDTLTAQQSTGVIGEKTSAYPNSSTVNATEMLDQEGRENFDFDFNYVNASDDAGMRSLFRAQLDGERFAPQQMDYGSIYACMLFRTNNTRQVIFCWIYDTAAGCTGSCSDQFPDVIMRMGFKGAITLPRLTTYNPTTKTLRLYPIKEIEALRGQRVYNSNGTTVATLPRLTQLVPMGTVAAPNATTNSSREAGANASSGAIQSTARQFEVQLNFTLLPPGASAAANNKTASRANTQASGAASADNANVIVIKGANNTDAGGAVNSVTVQPLNATGTGGAATSRTGTNARKLLQQQQRSGQGGNFRVGLRIQTGGNTYTDIYLSGVLADSRQGGSGASVAVANLSVWVDRSNAGPSSNTTWIEGGRVPLPVNGTLQVPRDKLGLSVWVDHSVIEVYALAGLARVTSKIYPEDDSVAWGLAAWAEPPTNGQWNVRMDGSVFEMQNAWLPPDCSTA